MSFEIGAAHPQFTFSPSPDEILTLDLASGCKQGELENLEYALDEVAQRNGLVVIEDDPAKPISIDVTASLEAAKKLPDNGREPGDVAAANFLSAIGFLLPPATNGSADRLVRLTAVGSNVVAADVYPSFQNWLNRTRLSRPVAKRAIRALVLPFGREETAGELHTYKFESGTFRRGSSRVALNGFETEVIRDPGRYHPKLSTGRQKPWRLLKLTTKGEFDEKPSLEEDTWYGRPSELAKNALYRMHSKNIRTPRQALSLLLGLGSFAHEAASSS